MLYMLLTNEEQKLQLINRAQIWAAQKLGKQKLSTGIAILGKPPKALLQDPKVQGKLLEDS